MSSHRTIAFVICALLAQPVAAQDKSAASVIQLPAAGGTVTQEEGQFRLNNNTGSANFSLPLPELPQRGRFGPTISLTYNQFAGDTGGGLGIGWSIGVPAIAFNDDLGTAIGGTQVNGDFFSHLSMMGARLIYLGNEGGVRRYRPEFSEQHVEILYHDGPFEVLTLGPTGGDEVVTVPSGFDVRNPDGTRMVFSGDPAVAEGRFDVAAPYVTRWPLVLQLNADRDAVRYSYVKHGGRSYLDEVAFAGGQSVYQFELMDTQASLVSNVNGSRQVNAKLYSRITARFRDSVYNRWCFGYIGRSQADNTAFQVRAHPDCLDQARADLEPLIDANSVNVLDQLRIVYRFGDTGGAALTASAEKLPDIALEYSSWTADDLAGRNIVFDAPNMAWAGDIPPWTFELADLNMDSLVDIVQTGDAATRIFAGEGDLANAFAVASDLTLSRPSESGMQVPVQPKLADDRFHFADILGDSYVDLVEVGEGVMHVFDGHADGAFPYFGRAIRLPGLSPTLFADGRGRFADINLDGQSDIVTTRLSADGRTEWQIFLNLTRRQPDGGHVVNFGMLPKAFPFVSQDGNILSSRATQLTDINGDRLPDLVVIRPADRGFCIYENRGNVFSADPADLLFGEPALNHPLCGPGRFTAIEQMGPNDRLETMWYVDANGDGIIDFANMGERTDLMRIWLGFGDGSFLARPIELELNLPVQVGAVAANFRSRVSDLDADGQSEIIVFQKPSGEDVRAVVVIDFNRTDAMQLAKANLLTTVAFGTGRRHDIRYATSTDEMLRDRANGVETRNLHFPVVLAKQMVTSEGIPGEPRAQVQTEEFFYHKPFYDVINGRFIGFAEVEKATYGDEFNAGAAITQRSSLAREQYYTFAETTADLHLAGKLKVRKTYEIEPDPVLLASAAATERLDPAAAGLHSLSTATRSQQLPREGRMLACESQDWSAVPRGDGPSFLRKLSETLSEAVGEDQVQPAADPACLNPTKTVEYGEFDEFNMPHVQTDRIRDVAGPLDVAVPGFARTTQTDYALSRAALADLGIVNAVSERRILTGTRLLSRESFGYLPDHGGRLGERQLAVFSGLGAVPEDLRDHHSPTHDLVRRMSYDVFGNVTGMSDDLGEIESVGFEPTGTLPLEHRRLNGADPALDQITRMTYDGPRAGAVATQVTPTGMTIAYGYDTLGRKISESAEDGAEKVYRYRLGEGGLPSLIMTSTRRYPTAAEAPEGESEWIDLLNAYDARGNEIASIENVAEGGVRVFNFSAYNRNGLRFFRWTPYTISEFDGATDLDVAAIFELGDIPRPERQIGNAYTYDGLGRMIRETHPSGKVGEVEHAQWGSRMRTFYADAFAGDVVSDQLRVMNENGMIATIVGDGAGENHVTRFARDSFGYLTEILLPGETEPRRFVHNSVGDLEYQAIPGMGEYYYFYDARGRQSAKARVAADGESHLIEIRYDFLNRKVAELENGVERVAYTYDIAVETASAAAFEPPVDRPLGEMPTMIVNPDPNGLFDALQRFGYDRNGRMVLNEIEIGGRSFAESFHHTLDGRIDRAVGPGGLESHFALGPDRNMRAVTIEHPSFAGPETVVENVAYNPEGRIERIDYRAGAFTTLTYDPDTLFLTRIRSEAGDVALQDLSMTFNQNGSINEIVDALPTGEFGHVNRSGRFEYDFKNQLVRTERYGETSEFAYSEAGTFRRNDEFAAGAELTPAPEAPTGLLPQGTADKAYSFDGFGQIATSPTLTGTVFDAYGRLIRAQTAENDVAFGYDQTGRRLYKQVTSLADPTQTTIHLFPMDSFEAGPQTDESFVNIGSVRLVRMEHATGRWFYYLKDHLDSSDYVIASDGTPVEQMLYRAYGTEHAPETLAPDWAGHVQTVSAALPREKTHHRFTGKYLDDATGLYYYGARYYDPTLGRFVSPDPLYMSDPDRCQANPIACNLFAYANNNPLAFIDPTGLDGVVAGDEAYRRQVEENLQRIDPTARVDRETGEISQSWLHGLWLDIKDFFVPGSGMDTGRELVSRIVESEQTATIQFQANTAGVDFDTSQGDPPPGPVDVTVSWDPAFTPTLTEFDAGTGTTARVAPDPAIVIGHELIHATHLMGGNDSGMASVNYTGLDGSPRTAADAEARTVGVGGSMRPDDITENDLREMLGINPRNHY